MLSGGFLSQMFGGKKGLSLLCRIQDLGCFMWNSHPSLFSKITLPLWSSQAVDLWDWSVDFPFTSSYLYFSSMSRCCPLLLKLCLPNFQVPFGGNYSICSCRFVYSMGGGEFKIFFYTFLNPPVSCLWKQDSEDYFLPMIRLY